MSALTVLFVTESVPSVRTTICSGGRLSTIVERKLNFPEIGPTVAEMIPAYVLSSIRLTLSVTRQQVENLLISMRKSPAFSARTLRSILPSKIIALFLLKQIQARSYVTKKALTSPGQIFERGTLARLP